MGQQQGRAGGMEGQPAEACAVSPSVACDHGTLLLFSTRTHSQWRAACLRAKLRAS